MNTSGGSLAIAGPAISIRGLRKTYGATHAVDGLDVTIPRGETFALLGPNGAGKSTTIEILEGSRRRSAGEVRVLGEDPAAGDLAWKARIGIVGQSTGGELPYTVRELVAHRARYYPRPRDVDDVIDAVGLTARAKVRMATLSGGQRRRLDVALGIVGRPELLFLDEPTTGFDPEARHDFWRLIRDLQETGTTILLTTHYLDEAAELADRVGIIARGRLVALGAAEEIGGTEARMPVVRWREDGVAHHRRTDAPGAMVAQLHARLGEPEGLAVHRPTLEDIYLDLVRDQASEATS